VSYLGSNLPIIPSHSGFNALLATPVLQPLGQTELHIDVEKLGSPSSLTLPVMVRDGGFDREDIWLTEASSSLLDPAITTNENTSIESLCKFESEQHWQGTLRYPLDNPTFTSDFGTVRSYNGGPYNSFHRGLDFRGDASTPVYAAADGVVIFSDALQVRGNTIFINHGLGVCTGYMHLSQRLMTTGDIIKAGDLLGYVGDTGMVTGAHLHWEVRIGGVAVEPKQWVEELLMGLESSTSAP
jgi:murein DD-endopeptidase MepM/ murein hydrolase activator NlpD